MLALSIILTGLLLMYSVLILFLEKGLRKLPFPGRLDPDPEDRLTVLIPFKDEEDHLQHLISDLLAQQCSVDAFQVLLVNDHSTDQSVELVENLIGGNPRFRLLNLPGGREGKKEALALGVDQAESPWILQVDADCRVEASFLDSHLRYAATYRPDLIAGQLRVAKGKGFFSVFEAHDVLSLGAAGAGSFYYGRPLMCSGANLMYRKELYRETRQYDPRGVASGDDMFLLIGARRLGKKLAFNPDPASVVLTGAQKNWPGLIRQRLRWGAKSTRYRMMDIQLTALLVFLANLAFVLIPLPAVLHPGILPVLLSAAILKLLADYLLIRRMARPGGQTKLLRSYLPVALLHPIYTVLLITGMPFRSSVWK